jgi:hypothetical protein
MYIYTSGVGLLSLSSRNSTGKLNVRKGASALVNRYWKAPTGMIRPWLLGEMLAEVSKPLELSWVLFEKLIARIIDSDGSKD